jgi:hypothetical protein
MQSKNKLVKIISTDKNRCPIISFSIYLPNRTLLLENVTLENQEKLKELATKNYRTLIFEFKDKIGSAMHTAEATSESISSLRNIISSQKLDLVSAPIGAAIGITVGILLIITIIIVAAFFGRRKIIAAVAKSHSTQPQTLDVHAPSNQDGIN